ncbi:MAG: hypothetical protein R2825_10740 [Saprospiraceae bacterium]
MSSLSSAFNSSSTLVTLDFYQQYKPDASDKDLVRFGQIVTVVLIIVEVLVECIYAGVDGRWYFSLFTKYTGLYFPPIAAVFLFGLLYKWINARGAIVTLWTGFIIGLTRLVF